MHHIYALRDRSTVYMIVNSTVIVLMLWATEILFLDNLISFCSYSTQEVESVELSKKDIAAAESGDQPERTGCLSKYLLNKGSIN